MHRPMVEENGEVNHSSYVKQETIGFGYDPSYFNYSATTANAAAYNQPLPGQPPLPPMPPPQGNAPPPPGIYGSVQAQITPIHWPHHPVWPAWVNHQAIMPAQSVNAVPTASAATGNFHRNMYIKKDRYHSYSRNQTPYSQKGKYQYKSQKRRYDQSQQNYHDRNNSHDWQRNSNEGHMYMQNQMHNPSTSANNRRPDDSGDPDIKEEIVIKKNKQRKPMSQSYPSRPWNRDDAEKALKVENDYNKTVKAQSLIIKFPDPDLNKDIVREFHDGIKNIHFQSPSGPRYCFIQMTEGVNIEEAIKDLEQIPFGNGYLKVERKSLRDEDTPSPEEIDPYTLYIGNLPETVNVNEVKAKFLTATRVDVGFAQKMRNTRYAFIRYNNVDESIAAYKTAHDLMWDTRSIIVRFRRQRGNTCLPGEPKSNPKKRDEVTKAPSATDNTQDKEKSNDDINKGHITSSEYNRFHSKSLEDKNTLGISSSNSIDNASTKDFNTSVNKKEQNKQLPQDSTARTGEIEAAARDDNGTIVPEIKEEPIDYDDMNEMYMGDEDDDDDDDEGEIYNQEMDDDSDYDDGFSKPSTKEDLEPSSSTNNIPADDETDQLFNVINNSITSDIGS